MKKYLLLPVVFSCLLFTLGSCKTSKKTTVDPTSKVPIKKETSPNITSQEVKEVIVGNDTDEQGCKGSAGYTYSSLQEKCIRVFDEGIRLDPKSPELNQSVSAFVVFKTLDENEQAEIFLPAKSSSFIMLKTGGQNEWIGNSMQLVQIDKTFSLYASDGELKYEGIDRR